MKKIYYLLFLFIVFAPSVLSAAFLDISNLNPYKDALVYLKAKSIISGYADGTYKPENSINRAELTKILIESTNVELVSDSNCFPDVSGSDWYVKYVCTAKSLNWVQGYPDGRFKPSQYINRAEALRIISKAENWDFDRISESAYSDVNINDWYGKFVNFAKESNFVTFNNSFSPATYITRGDFAETYYRILYSKENNLLTFPGSDSEQIKTGKDYEPAFFDSVVLDSPFPSYFVRSEVYSFSGKSVSASHKSGMLVLFNKDGKTVRNVPFKIINSRFEVSLSLDSLGEFGIGIVTGENTKTKIAPINVVDFGSLYTLKESLPVPDDINLSELNLEYVSSQTKVNFLLEDPEYPVFFRFDFVQDDNVVSYYSRQINAPFTIKYSDFSQFDSGKVSLVFFVANIGNGVSSNWSEVESYTFNAVNHYFSQISSKVSDVVIPDFLEKGKAVNISGIAQDILDSDLHVILPSGLVEKIDSNEDYIRTGESFDFSYTPAISKPYIFEINNASGLAVVNYAIYPKGSIPLIPDYFDLNKATLTPGTVIDEDNLKDELSDLVNSERKKYGFATLKIDSKLSDLAEEHNLDMLKNNYLGHINLSGETPNDRRIDYGISTPVGENVAKVLSVESGHENLMRSAAHRANILNPLWTKVGFSIKKNTQGYLYIVEEFSYTNASINDYFEAGIKNLNSNLLIDDSLNSYTDYWTENMLSNDFFSTSYNDETIFDMVDTSQYDGLKSVIVKGTNLDALIEELKRTTDISNLSWTKFGFSLDFDVDGAAIISLMWGN